jgi:hypothetical protein
MRFRILLLAILGLGLAHSGITACSSGASFGLGGGADSSFDFDPTDPNAPIEPDPEITIVPPGDGSDGGDPGFTQGPGGDQSDPPPSEGDDDPEPGDPNPPGGGDPADGCFTMRVISEGCSAAWIRLNGEDIFRPDSFHNEDRLVLDRRISPKRGANQVEIRLAGSPGDSLEVQIFDCDEDPAKLLMSVEVIRTKGKPAEDDGSF